MASYSLGHRRDCSTDSSPLRRVISGFLLIAFIGSAPVAGPAADNRAEPQKPAAVFVAAGVDRLLSDVETVMVSAERRDIYETLKGLLANLGDFEGMDRSRPFGVMVFLGQGLVPTPEPIGFVPVSDRDKLLKTIAFGPIMTKPVNGKPDRFEIAGPNGSVQLQFDGRHALIAPMQVSLDRKFPDPDAIASALAEKHDLAVSLDLTAIPVGLKRFGVGALRERVDADLKKEATKAGSDEEELRLRREIGLSIVDWIDDAATRGRALTLGGSISQKSTSATLQFGFVTDKKPEEPAAAPAASEALPPAEFVLHLTLSEKNRVRLKDLAALAERKLKATAKPEDLPLIHGLLGPAQATLEEGRIDFRVGFVGTAPGPFSLVGSLGLQKSEQLAEVLPAVLDRLKSTPKIESITPNAATIHGIAMHHVMGKDSNPQDERLYGEKPSALFGAGKNRFGFALGGKSANDDLSRFLETPAAPDGPDVLRLRISAGSWVAIASREGEEENPGLKIARKAFARGKDEFRLEATSGVNGPVVRLSIEEGFLRAIGLAIAAKVDGAY